MIEFLPADIYPDNETVERDMSTPSQRFAHGAAEAEKSKLRMYHLNKAEWEIDRVFADAANAERVKIGYSKGLYKNDRFLVIESEVWHGAPLQRLAYIHGRRVLVGLGSYAAHSEDWDCLSEVHQWFMTKWLPRADAVTSTLHIMERAFSRTRPTEHIYMPLALDYREKFTEIMQRVLTKNPELATDTGWFY